MLEEKPLWKYSGCLFLGNSDIASAFTVEWYTHAKDRSTAVRNLQNRIYHDPSYRKYSGYKVSEVFLTIIDFKKSK